MKFWCKFNPLTCRTSRNAWRNGILLSTLFHLGKLFAFLVGVKQVWNFPLMYKGGALYLIYSHVRYGVHTKWIQDCSSLNESFISLQIHRVEVDFPILTPHLDYSKALTYPPKRLLTISPPPAEVGLPHSNDCPLLISGFSEKVQFTLKLRPRPYMPSMMEG